MNIETQRFGTLTIEASKIIEFPLGLAGFENSRRFSLFHSDAAPPKFFILQSLDDPELALHVTDPAQLGFNYEITLSDAETETLQLADPSDAVVAVILWKEAAATEAGNVIRAGTGLRANLNAPLVINTKERLGLQHIFARLNYTIVGE